MSWIRSAALTVFALTTGCGVFSSFSVELNTTNPAESAKELRSLFIVVGPESTLALERGADPMQLVAPTKQGDYEAIVQLDPGYDKQLGITWTPVLEKHRSEPKRVTVTLAPLSIELADSLTEEGQQTGVRLIAHFADGTRATQLISNLDVSNDEPMIFDLSGHDLKRR